MILTGNHITDSSYGIDIGGYSSDASVCNISSV